MKLFIFTTPDDSDPRAIFATKTELSSVHPEANVIQVIELQNGTGPTADLLKTLLKLSGISEGFGIKDALEDLALTIWSAAKEA